VARKLVWVGSSQKDFLAFPQAVRFDILAALSIAQDGDKAMSVKPLKGFSGASVLEVIENDQSGTYRCVYTIRFQTAIYVLHAFQKKSRKGIATPKEHLEMIERRLKQATELDGRERKRPL
jgi:phage-related protein